MSSLGPQVELRQSFSGPMEIQNLINTTLNSHYGLKAELINVSFHQNRDTPDRLDPQPTEAVRDVYKTRAIH